MEICTKKVCQLIDEGVIFPPIDGNHGEKHPKTSDYVDKGIPFILVQDLKDGTVDLEHCYYIAESQAKTLTKGISKTDDVLFTHKATIGKVAIVDTQEYDYIILTPQVTYYRIKNSNVLSNKYLYFYFQSKAFQDIFRLYASSGGTRDYLGIVAQQKLPIVYPTIEYQQRIVNVLEVDDKRIANNSKRIKVLEQMAENLYKEWFVRFRFPGHESVPFENGLPQGWEKKRTNELCTFLNGFAFKSEEYDENGEFIVVTIKNVQDGLFDLSSIERIGTIPKRMPEYCRLKKGDVLMSLTGNVARVCIVSENNCLLNQRVCRIESDYPHYSYLFFKQEAIYSTLCNLAYGTAQLNLSPILAGKLKVALPPAPLRKQFNDSVSTLFEQRQVLIEENNNLVKQRDLLLPRLMSGKLEV